MIKKISLNSLLMALCCIVTMLIQIPISFNNGYINIGDSIIILSAILFGPTTGFLVGAIGSMFADVFSGFIVFAPFTLIIKGFEGFVIGKLFIIFKQKKIAIVLSSLIGLLWMVFGYFIVDLLLGYEVLTSLTGSLLNLIQAGICFVVGITLVFIFNKINVTKKLSV